MISDIQAIFERDPAATNIFEVLLYQGLWAIWIHRISHVLYKWRIPILPRLISQIMRLLTMIEIHPGAKIGKKVFIDHGCGVVIGETAVIGDNVTIYQGVTLGGTGKEKGKRHPTIGNNVVIGAEAIILGNITIGDFARVGAAAVVTKPVPSHSTVVGNPARIVVQKGQRIEPLAHNELPDPVAKALEEISQRLEKLEKKK
ncbi:MAG: serine O-acetyltransferase [Candidatus Margulisbacteria bacterium]|nr:serine O-acetyltransferase [Candidatus Margulisiibacteriota bacterium]MBU1616247.1 serine O-acetyltransferase [Candidatus Margulisiibacteriota bacterium]MBU1867425.1 serine O-acetyltransferase [Candidatus Margulisiibacteriota bacterium]